MSVFRCGAFDDHESAPDYVINAGRPISVGSEVARIGEILRELFERAERDRVPTNVVADRMAEERLKAAAFPEASLSRPATGRA